MDLSPDRAQRGQTLIVTVSNAPLHHTAPGLEFRRAGSPSGSDVEAVGRGRWVPPSSYEYDVRVAPNAALGDYVGYLSRNRAVGPFTVLEARSVARGGLVIPTDLARRIFDVEARIFEAEADLLEAIARAAGDGARDPAWLTAAAEKECAAAQVIEALAEKERVLADAS